MQGVTFLQNKHCSVYETEQCVKSRNKRLIIDYVPLNKRNRTDINDFEIKGGTEIYSEYHLTPERVKQNKDFIYVRKQNITK